MDWNTSVRIWRWWRAEAMAVVEANSSDSSSAPWGSSARPLLLFALSPFQLWLRKDRNFLLSLSFFLVSLLFSFLAVNLLYVSLHSRLSLLSFSLSRPLSLLGFSFCRFKNLPSHHPLFFSLCCFSIFHRSDSLFSSLSVPSPLALPEAFFFLFPFKARSFPFSALLILLQFFARKPSFLFSF